MYQVFQIFFPCNVISSFLGPFTYYNAKQERKTSDLLEKYENHWINRFFI